MAKAGGSPWWLEPPDSHAEGGIDESLQRAMDEDPRLGSGAGPARSDNVLDFIQMTGLTAGRVPAVATPAPSDLNDDPISFFEFGVRDVDGSGDPVEPRHSEFDLDAFHVERSAAPIEESQSLVELRQIIAELAEESDPARTAYARLAAPDAAPAIIREPEVISSWSPGQPSAIGAAALAEAPPALDALDFPKGPGEPASASLAAARDLVRELSQANDAAAEKQRSFAAAPFDLKHPVTAAREGLPEPEEDREDYSSHQHIGLQRRRHNSFLRRWLPRVALLAIAAAAGYGIWQALKFRTQPPRAAFVSAQAALDAGDHRRASNDFLAITQRFESHPVAPDALFMAGYALQLEPESPPAAAKEAYTEAVGIFEKFLAEYPAHEKAARAETLMGLLYFKTGRFLEAISILGDVDRRTRDPGAYLIALRTLARAYAEIGQMENARSVFLRAAALESNMTPDQDYVELANLYQSLAARSGDPAQRRSYFRLAVEQWDFAMQVPGLLRSRKEDIKLLRDAAVARLETESGNTATEATGAREARPLSIEPGIAAGAAGETPLAESSENSGPTPK